MKMRNSLIAVVALALCARVMVAADKAPVSTTLRLGKQMLNGPVKPNDLKGRALLLFFWETDSTQWQGQVAALNELADDYRAKRFLVVSILKKADPFAEVLAMAYDIRFPVVYSGELDEYYPKNTPDCLLFNCEGILVKRCPDIKDLKADVAKLMKETPALLGDEREYVELKSLAKKAQELGGLDDVYKEAAKILNKETPGSSRYEEAKALYHAVDEYANAGMERAEAALEISVVRGVAMFQAIAAQFKGHIVADDAELVADEVMKTEEYKMELAANVRARKLLEAYKQLPADKAKITPQKVEPLIKECEEIVSTFSGETEGGRVAKRLKAKLEELLPADKDKRDGIFD